MRKEMAATCGRCGRTLKDQNSIILGYGKVCALKIGIIPKKRSRKANKKHDGPVQLSLWKEENPMPTCGVCECEIKFIRNKKENITIAVEPNSVYFIPPNGFDKVEKFINIAGQEVQGCRAPDGMTGYKRHEC